MSAPQPEKAASLPPTEATPASQPSPQGSDKAGLASSQNAAEQQQQQKRPPAAAATGSLGDAPALMTPLTPLRQDQTAEGSVTTSTLRTQDFNSVALPLPASTELRANMSYSHVPRPLEIMESIKGLHELHQRGGLTKEEFTQAKQQILESSSSSTSSSTSTDSTRSKKLRTRHHRRHGRRGTGAFSSSSRSKSTRDGHSHARSKSTRKRSSRTSHSRRSSSTESSSSDSSSSNRFIVVPRANVWRTLNERLDDASMDHDSAVLRHSPVAANAFPPARSPLAGQGIAVPTFRVDDGDDAAHCVPVLPLKRADGYEAIGTDDRLSQRGSSERATVPSPVIGEPEHLGGAHLNSDHVSVAAGVPHQPLTRPPGSLMGSELRDKAKYGTLLHRDDGVRVTTGASMRAELNREDVVRVRYFNSRGGSGNHFADVELKPSEMRDPVYLSKGRSQVVYTKLPSSVSGARRNKEEQMVMAVPTQDSQVFQIAEMTPDERKAWEELSSTRFASSDSSSTRSSYLEQSLNWYWIDVTGRDPGRKRYNATLRFLTTRFKLCESFLVDRDHMLVLPQVCESPNFPGQYLLNLRVATDKIAISDDSVMELTNRWIIVVDLKRHLVITLHRVDTHSMANLRLMWKKVIENSDVSFQEFLLKIIDDAIHTYQTSIDVHTDVLDKCEAKLFVDQSGVAMPAASGHYIDMRILHHFAGSSRSVFLRRLLDDQDRRPMNKTEMNSFLHHLHRRTSVQHRMLNLTQLVLVKAVTKLRLCSREMADQMCTSCLEVSDRALEVRDDAKTLLDLHISLQSFRTNELMAVLTRVSLLFTPITFLAGVYGMNFQKNFPELTWEYGYPFFWGMVCVLVVVMQLFFLKER